MKWKVVGWTYYENFSVEDEDSSDAVVYAIIDEIKKNGYLFSGYDHQERFNCVPVMNDGKKRTFSQRTFGNIMAIAHGYTGRYDYSLFSFGIKEESLVIPNDSFNEYTFVPEKDMNEEFVLNYSDISFVEEDGKKKIKIPDFESLRYLDKGDTLIIKKEDVEYKYIAGFVIREKDISKKELRELESDLYILDQDSEEYKLAEEKYNSLEKVIMVEIEE